MSMKLNAVYLFALVVLLAGCDNEPEPEPTLPESIKSYFILYNFLMEPYDVAWDVGGTVVHTSQPYGVPIIGLSILDNIRQDVTFTVRKSGTSQVVESDIYTMHKDRFYIVSVLGSEEDPYILFEPMNLDPPAAGMVRVRFMQAVRELNPVDIYIGGNTPGKRLITGITYTDITGYVDVTEDDAWHSLLVTPYETAPTDSTILSFTENEVFEPDLVYLGVITHISNTPSSSIQMLLYGQPLEY